MHTTRSDEPVLLVLYFIARRFIGVPVYTACLHEPGGPKDSARVGRRGNLTGPGDDKAKVNIEASAELSGGVASVTENMGRRCFHS